MSLAEILVVTLAFLAGLAIGAAFFGGLWWTVSRGIRSKRPALLFVTSLLVRITFAMMGLYAVGHAHLERLIACVFGFFGVRFLIPRFTRRPAKGKI
jgi:F1F0 ATPase subunit 2